MKNHKNQTQDGNGSVQTILPTLDKTTQAESPRVAEPWKTEAESFPAVSLFLSWYLRREQLVKNKKIKALLDEMEGGRKVDTEQWSGSLRGLLSTEALRVLNRLLERPLTGSELVRLFERIDEFIQLYAVGIKP